MRPAWLLVLAASGCRGILGIEPARLLDAAVDAPDPDAPDSCTLWHPQGIDPCALGAPMPALQLGPGRYTYDTTLEGGKLSDATGQVVARSRLTASQPDSSMLAVLSVEALTVDAGAIIDVIGLKPLVVVSWSTIRIDGAIDAGSHLGVTSAADHISQTLQVGAGANEACATSLGGDGAAAPSTGGSGAGGGGGLQGSGGHGGSGVGTPGALGGAGGEVTSALVLRGGCPGGASGTAGGSANLPATPSSRALGGGGGGAIRLVANVGIDVSGSISANGAGGAGAPLLSSCGGGGGGSGGMIAFEAPSVMVGGKLTANGGGGGGGGGPLDAGNDGSDGQVDTAAPGGMPGSSGCGQAGGAGSVLGALGGSSVSGGPGCGGGGGGGGAAGILRTVSPAYQALPTATISPSMSVL